LKISREQRDISGVERKMPRREDENACFEECIVSLGEVNV
jgi:hypothetical protein